MLVSAIYSFFLSNLTNHHPQLPLVLIIPLFSTESHHNEPCSWLQCPWWVCRWQKCSVPCGPLVLTRHRGEVSSRVSSILCSSFLLGLQPPCPCSWSSHPLYLLYLFHLYFCSREFLYSVNIYTWYGEEDMIALVPSRLELKLHQKTENCFL